VINADRDFATMRDFIVGRLSDDERRAFEDRLVRDPGLVRELERSLRMREGLQQLRTQGYFRKAASRGRSLRIWVPTLVAAAGAGLAVFLWWLSHVTGPSPILMPALDSRATASVTPLVAARFTFVSVRGGSAPDLDLPSAGLIEIRAAPSMQQTVRRYRVTLIHQEERGFSEPIADVAGLARSTDGYVHCYADASRLTRGSYILRIQPDTDSEGMMEDFPFNLRAGVTGLSR
jgi:hypothetical protein